MKKLMVAFFACLLAGTSQPGFAQGKGTAKHVILICVDGFRPDFYLESKWPAPTIQRLAKAGICARGMRPVVPSVTLPDHTTMITGALPAKHGVYHNQPFDPQGWNGGSYSNSNQIKTPTLWDAVKQAGGTSASLNWPVSGEAPVDWNYRSYRTREDNGANAFLTEIEENVTGKMPVYDPKQPSTDFDSYAADLRVASVGAYLIQKHKPTLMTVHFVSTDHAQHEQGREGEKVYQAIAIADVCVSQLVEATKKAGTYENTVFIVAGDHGFEDRHTQLAWNALLIKEGLLENKPDRGNWKACFKDQFLMLRDPKDKATLARVRKLLEEQPAPIRKLYRIVERAELDQYGADPNAVLAVQPVEGVVCTSRYNLPELVQSTPGGSHGLLPDRPSLYAGFIAFGPGLRKKAMLPELGMEDVAPLAAYALGLDFKAPDGILYPGLIAEEFIKGY
ncbi:MAG: alkaline phosphatase family protein [Ferruginibacter sp.]|nr:alkaline phosphatase family protein [Cytophagales bacterium]